jgi:hypothetical protein
MMFPRVDTKRCARCGKEDMLWDFSIQQRENSHNISLENYHFKLCKDCKEDLRRMILEWQSIAPIYRSEERGKI